MGALFAREREALPKHLPGMFAFAIWDEKTQTLFCARDRFGDHGLVAAALVRKERAAWRIDSFLMSCRVIGYGVETAFLAALAAEARREVTALIGEFIPTKKNAPAKDCYPRHGFVRSRPEAGGGTSEAAIELWRLELAPDSVPWPTWITAVTPKRRSEA